MSGPFLVVACFACTEVVAIASCMCCFASYIMKVLRDEDEDEDGRQQSVHQRAKIAAPSQASPPKKSE